MCDEERHISEFVNIILHTCKPVRDFAMGWLSGSIFYLLFFLVFIAGGHAVYIQVRDHGVDAD